MICKKKKNKYTYVFLLSLILVCGLLQSSALSCNTYASSTTTVNDYLNSNNFYDVCAYFCRGIASFPDAYGGGTGFTVEAFADYLEEKGKSSILNETVTITEPTNESSGGRGYDLPQEARQEIVNFVNETYIEQNPLSYSQCYINSYNFISTSQFSSYTMYKSFQEIVKNFDGYTLCRFQSGNQPYIYYTQIPRSDVFGLYGTTTAGGFTSVHAIFNWSASSTSPYIQYYMNAQGNVSSYPANNKLNITNIYNTSGIKTYSNEVTIFSNQPKNELVYVFNTVDAYKAYNAGTPQSYYMLTDPNYVVPYEDTVTYEDVSRAGGYYNSIVNNVNTGDSAEEVQKTVKSGLLGNLLDTLTGSNSSTALDVGNFDTSFLGTIKDLVLGVTGAIDPAEQLVNTDLRRFVTDIFGWLPGEIVTFWIAGILFAVLFGVLKIIRG